MNQQLFDKALKEFQNAAALDPNLKIARLNQGIALLNLGKVEAAKPILEEAVKRDPERSACLVQPGIALQEFRQRAGCGGCFPQGDRDRSQ